MAEFDLVVRGGNVHDGNGSEPRTADVAVNDGVIAAVGKVDGAGTREIDADGALVMPGMVDIHAHYDGQATWDDHMAPSSWHGVTTVVMGNCGVGFAPVHDDDHQRLIELMEGVEDIPGAALDEGLAWNWNSFDDYLTVLEQRPRDIDVGAQLPHGALRLHVMGERGANREDATADDIAAMATFAAEAMDAGALGFTTSRTTNHRTSRGDYTPTLTAAADELVGIASALKPHGRGVLQVVSDFTTGDDEVTMLHDMMRVSGRPLSVSIGINAGTNAFTSRVLDALTTAREQGLAMTGQVATRPIGVILGFDCTLNPFMRNPAYQEIADLPNAERLARLGTAEVRQALIGETEAAERNRLVGSKLITRFDNMFELTDPPNYEPSPHHSVAARASVLGIRPEELALDLLLADDGQGLLYTPFLNYVDGSLDALREMLVHPHTVPGLADGGAHVGTICDGSFPTTYLTHWGRDRDHGQIDLAYLVQQHCRDTARTVELFDRGVLAPGYRADINVIDFATLGVRKPHLQWDLPAGGRRLLQHAHGYLHTVVGGQETYRDGTATGELPGRLVRGRQAAPHQHRP